MDKRSKADQLTAKLVAALKREREAQGISKRALSVRSGISRTAVRMIEAGERQPTLSTLAMLCEALDVELWQKIREVETK